MAAESVQIVLEGVDKASPAFTSVARSIKETSEQSQKLGGVFGQIFSALGFNELSMLTSEFQGLSAQMKELGEAGSKGGAGMMLAKAGIVAAAAVATYEVGNMIADWIMQTDQWRERLNQTLTEAGEQADFLTKKRRQQFDQAFELASLGNPEQQQAEMAALAQQVNKDIVSQAGSLQRAIDDLKAVQGGNSFAAGYQEELQAATKLVEIETQRMNQLKEQNQQIKDFYSLPTEAEQELQKRRDMAAKEKEGLEELRNLQLEIAKIRDPAKAERDATLAKAANEEQRKLLTYMLDMKDAAKAKAAAEAEGREEMKRSIAETKQAMEQREKLNEEILKAQKQLSDEQKRQDDELAKKMATPAPQLQAMQSRLLSRSGQSNTGERQAKANEKVAELTARIETLQREQQTLLSDIRNNTRNTIKVVS